MDGIENKCEIGDLTLGDYSACVRTYDEAITKLNRYEATGLEPEIVEKLAKMLQRGVIVLSEC